MSSTISTFDKTVLSPIGTMDWLTSDEDEPLPNVITLKQNTTIELEDLETSVDETSFPEIVSAGIFSGHISANMITIVTDYGILISSLIGDIELQFDRLIKQAILTNTIENDDAFLTMLASEEALKQDWDTEEEDEAWAHL